MKKSILALFVLIILALGAWWFFQDKDGVEITETTPTGGSPFGTVQDVNIPALGETPAPTGQESAFDTVTPDAQVFRISSMPVAGFTLITKNNEPVARYVDRGTGHILDVSLITGEEVKISNSTLPKIYEAHFRADGLAVLLRSLESDTDSVKNLSLTLTAPRATSTDAIYSVSAANLRGDIDSVVVSGNTLNYVLKNTPSVSSSNFVGGDARTLYTLPFSGWRLTKMGTSILMYPKAHSQVSGIAYSLNGGALNKQVGPYNGLTAVPNSNGTKILYSYSEAGVTKLAVKTLSSGGISEILPATLSEKCVWSSKNASILFCGTPINGVPGSEPDNWYLGRTHYTDYLWSFDTGSDIAQLISEPKTDLGLDLDISEPKLTPNEDYFVFINKRNLTLWAIKLR